MKKTKNKNEDLKYRITNTRHSTVLAVFRKKGNSMNKLLIINIKKNPGS